MIEQAGLAVSSPPNRRRRVRLNVSKNWRRGRVYCAGLHGKLDGAKCGVRRRLGLRQTFLLTLLLLSRCRYRREDGTVWAVVSAQRLCFALELWDSRGALRCNRRKRKGRKRESLRSRISKMWRGFVDQLEQEPGLRGCFDSFKDRNKKKRKLYGMRVCTTELDVYPSSVRRVLRRLARAQSRGRTPFTNMNQRNGPKQADLK